MVLSFLGRILPDGCGRSVGVQVARQRSFREVVNAGTGDRDLIPIRDSISLFGTSPSVGLAPIKLTVQSLQGDEVREVVFP
jgi:hypothetical protein